MGAAVIDSDGRWWWVLRVDTHRRGLRFQRGEPLDREVIANWGTGAIYDDRRPIQMTCALPSHPPRVRYPEWIRSRAIDALEGSYEMLHL